MKTFVTKFVRTVKRIFNRTAVCVIGILIQLGYLIWLFWSFGTAYTYSYWILEAAAVLIAFTVVNSDKHPNYKISWMLPILIVPFVGVMLYICFGSGNSGEKLRQRMNRFNEEEHLLLPQKDNVILALESGDGVTKDIAKQANYLYKFGGYPVYANSDVTYFDSGEAKFAAMCEELEKAERFIFLEYFIIQEGTMWNTILEILVRKAAKGVDVRMVYDDLGCLRTLPYKYYAQMESLGIKCMSFNKFHPFWVARMNNRDHRKILVIDGHTAFNGGVNLADEYINVIKKHGEYWKDSAVMIKGEAVWSFTMMFLTMWNYITNTKPQSYDIYMPTFEDVASHKDAHGLVIPYTDSPLDKESVGENTYISIINNATDYVYITTPYLIITNEMEAALTLAAKSGVDVRIITPHVPDKWYVHAVTRSYYKTLTKNNVRIYEFTPGFIHAKNFVSDNKVGVVGTINLDYRSLYLHFECGTYMYKTGCILDVKADFLKTLEECQEITYEDCLKVNPLRRLGRSILRLFAPLM